MDLPDRIARRLALPLPGRAAQARFEPEGAGGRHYLTPENARSAAVLVLVYPDADGWRLPLTLRPDTLPDHPGQVSLPGGAVDPGEDTAATALRELREELGVTTPVRLLGRLSPIYVFASNFAVTPWVGAIEVRPQWTPSPAEVAEVLEPPLAHLLNPANYGTHPRELAGRSQSVPHIVYERHRIWGATSMILSEFADVAVEALGG